MNKKHNDIIESMSIEVNDCLVVRKKYGNNRAITALTWADGREAIIKDHEILLLIKALNTVKGR